jgi:hypothetical protein
MAEARFPTTAGASVTSTLVRRILVVAQPDSTVFRAPGRIGFTRRRFLPGRPASRRFRPRTSLIGRRRRVLGGRLRRGCPGRSPAALLAEGVPAMVQGGTQTCNICWMEGLAYSFGPEAVAAPTVPFGNHAAGEQ